MPRILIIGAGPAGLGAAWRLNELGHSNWLLVEKHPVAGGLSASFTDRQGFTWDLGGHVLFSHYSYFDRLMDELLGDDGWLWHERESWIWIRDRFVPYPFQFNIRHLPREDMERCIAGLRQLHERPRTEPPRDFGEWIDATMGRGLAEIFMRPYNYKVWGYPPETMDCYWTGDRVAPVDLARVLRNIEEQRDDISWGPNNRFRFPRFGGTGAIWRECARWLPTERLRFSSEVVRFDARAQEVRFDDGTREHYDLLLTTMPLDRLIDIGGLDQFAEAAAQLRYSSTHVFGIGLRGKPRTELAPKCWMYFPEDNSPFYRVTLFSNYSPNNVPDISRYWSLMAEVSESPEKPVLAPHELLEQVIQGMLNTKLIERRDQICNTWQTRIEYGYPTPAIGRDEALDEILPELEKLGIYSRGRFGAWKYEVGNQDHSLMQGVEWVNRVLNGTPEETLPNPHLVNSRYQKSLL